MNDIELMRDAVEANPHDDAAMLALADAYLEEGLEAPAAFAKITVQFNRAQRAMGDALRETLVPAFATFAEVVAKALQKSIQDSFAVTEGELQSAANNYSAAVAAIREFAPSDPIEDAP